MKSRAMVVLFAVLLPVAAQFPPAGQASNGSDGDLTFPNAKSGDVIIFDPKDTKLFPGGLDSDNDNVYHFKSIIIPTNVRVVLRSDKLGGPVYWLATGNITINGHLDADGNPGAGPGVSQTFAIPGPGGFHGGAGGDNATRPQTVGFGPAGGLAGKSGGCDTAWATGGGFTGNEFLVPLIGGSGGGGYFASAPQVGPGGGAGGGAILLVSPGTITISASGSITARGGSPGGNIDLGSGGGAGGAIRLAANRIEGTGLLSAAAAVSTGNTCRDRAAGKAGRVRLEAFQQVFGGTLQGDVRNASPYDTFVPGAGTPSVRVISVAGKPVTANSTGLFEIPDVTIDAPGAVPVVIETRNVTSNAVVKLILFSENGASPPPIDFPALPSGGPVLQTTANVKFPSGFSRGFVRVTFTTQ